MLFALVVIIAVASTAATIWADWNDYEITGCFGAISTLTTAVAVVMLLIICLTHLNEPGDLALNQQRYEALVYKATTEEVRDEFGVLNKEYIDEIQGWNEDVARGRAMQDDFWLGVFWSNIYDDLEYIDLEQAAICEEAK